MVRVAVVVVALMMASPALAQTEASSESIHLVCLGAGGANRLSSSTVFGMNSDGDSAWGNVLGQRTVGFDDAVELEIPATGRARIRMPRAMLPPVRGGKNGWFWVDDVRRAENEITGTVQVNVFNSPKLRLDRIQGRISINGKAGDFSGECRRYDPATVERKF